MKTKSELQAGIFILVALLLFGMSVFVLGRERQIFSAQDPFHTSFRDIKGLGDGAPVRLGGINIGRVSKIGFAADLKDPNVYVTLLVNDDYLDRIREDAVVLIDTQGLLGDRFLNITTGASEKILPPGSHIPSKESGDIADVLAKAGTVVDNTVQISDNVNEFLKEFRHETLSHFTEATKSIATLSKEIKDGSGLLHDLIYKKEGGDSMMKNLEAASSDIKAITQEIRSGSGLLNSLVYAPEGKETVEALTLAAKNLATASSHISELAGEIQSGDGLLHDLIYAKSPEGLDDVVAKLNETANNLKSASDSLASGSGTIGALLVDSKLYDNLVEVTDGAKRSFILRQAIRSSLEK